MAPRPQDLVPVERAGGPGVSALGERVDAVPAPAAGTHERIHYLDNLRALAMFAGVLFHASLAYSPLMHPFWVTADRGQWVGVDIAVWFLHLFRMPLFFVIAGFFFYNSASEMWWGGFTVGPRYLVPMLPFVTIPIIFAFNRLFVHLGGRLVGALLVLASIFSVAIMTIGGQGWPPVNEWPLTINQMNASFPLVDYSLPLVIEGNVARNYGMFVGLKGLFSLIPLLVVVGVLLSLLLGLLRRSTRQTNFSASKLKIVREA